MDDLTSRESDSRRNQAVLGGIAALHATLLALPLFFSATFAFDWINHLWFANYVAQHLASSGTPPMFANLTNGVGNPIFVFYGSALYTTLAPLVLIFGPNLGMRIAVFAAFLLPNLALAHFVRRCLEDRWGAGSIAIVLSTSLYQLTNIYTRGAVTEFFAYQFLLLGVVMLMDAVLDQDSTLRSVKVVLGCISVAIGALTHPPTAYLSVLFLGLPASILTVTVFRAAPPGVQPTLTRFGVLLVVLAPIVAWAALTVAESPKLTMNEVDLATNLILFPQSIDHWLARFLPWPMDFRVEIDGFDLVSTPYLSAPVNSIGLLLWLYLGLTRTSAGKNRRKPITFLAVTASAVCASILSSLPFGPMEGATAGQTTIPGWFYVDPFSWRGQALGRIQFAYRLVNVANFGIFLGCLGLLLTTKVRDRESGSSVRESSRILFTAAAAICLSAAGMKITEVYKEFTLLPKYSDRLLPAVEGTPLLEGIVAWVSADRMRRMDEAVHDINRAPVTQYGLSMYSMPHVFPAHINDGQRVEIPLSFEPVGATTAFATTSCGSRCALVTNLVSSTFFTLSIDGASVPVSAIHNRAGFIIVLADAGHHRLQVKLGTWATQLLAYSTAALVFLFWTAVLLLAVLTLMSIVAVWKQRRASVPAP